MSYYLKAVISAAPLLKREWSKKERLALQDAVRIAMPKHRAAACLRHRLGASAVAVSATREGNTRLGGLMICSASHVCPICHHNKMSQDKAMIAEIVAEHYAVGGFMVDAVLTVPHAASESLADVLGRLESVWKSLRSKPVWRVLADELGIVGCVRRLEVTLTANGWHPHYHVSFLCDWGAAKGIKGGTRQSALADVHALVAGRWSEAGRREGITVCLYAQAAVAIVAAVDAAKAVAYNAKNMGYGDGKNNSLTPMDLLRIIGQIADPAVTCAAKRLFAEYVTATKGKHALSFLGIARSAKAAIAQERMEDESGRDEAELLGTISIEGWDAVVNGRLREAVAQVVTREELAALVLCAACIAGYTSLPTGWLSLTPGKKTVIGVKSNPTLVSSLGSEPV
jgi:hypothetical protein